MLKGKGSLFCIAFAFSTFASAATTITPVAPAKSGDCYQISSAAELYGFAAIVNGTDGFTKDTLACGKLTKDIVVNANVLDEEGNLNVADTANFAVWTAPVRFTGSFDGQGHSISGLFLDDTTSGYAAGLFGTTVSPYLTAYGQGLPYPEVPIKNVHVKDSYFRANYNVGGIVGYASSCVKTIIENCSFDGVVKGRRHVGGIIGGASGGDGVFVVKETFNKGSVFAGSGVGGIVGGTYYMSGSMILNSYNAGTVTSDTASGGIIGESYSSDVVFVNVMNLGEVRLNELDASINVKSIVGEGNKPLYADNVFYLAPGRNEAFGTAVTAEQLADGSLATLMHDYNYAGIDGSVWGQNVGTDDVPVFSGEVKNASFASRTITLDTHGGDAVEMLVPNGFEVRIPDVERTGFENLGWYANAEFTGNPVTHIAAADTDVTVWGKFMTISSITLHTNGGTIDSGDVSVYTETVGALLPRKVTRKGYVFAGWYAEEDFNGPKVLAVDPATTGAQEFFARWYKTETPEKSSAGCYVISTAAELYGFAAIVNGSDGTEKEMNACAGLANDIVVNENVLKEDGSLDSANVWKFVPWTPVDSFAGVFDGNGHVVSGLFYDDSTTSSLPFGFFRTLMGTSSKYAELKNFGLEDSYFAASVTYFGAILGLTANAELGNRNASPVSYVKISGVYNASTIYTYNRPQSASGIVGSVGYKGYLTLENVYNRGRVIGKNVTAAGLVGHNMADTKITAKNCYSVWKTKDGMDTKSKSLFRGYDSYYYTVSNCYYLNTQGYSEGTGLSATADMFSNGTVALALREGENGDIWGQNVGTDAYPNFSGELLNSLAKEYKVTFHTFEGDEATYFDSYIAGFWKQLPKDVYMPNATFMGWFDNAEFEGERVNAVLETDTGDVEYWAKLLRAFSVTYNTNGGNIISGNIISYTETVGLTLPTDVRLDSNVFAGWYDNEELTGTPVTKITPEDTGDKTYYAAWFKLKMPVLDSADMCYEISDAAELYGFASIVSGTHYMYYNSARPEICGKLTKDIVVNENVLKEDGTLDSANAAKFLPWEMMPKFSGKFDGQGHKISGLYGVAAPKKSMAFFGELQQGNYDWEQDIYLPVTIKNLTIEDSYFSAGRGGAAGFITGTHSKATAVIDSCNFRGYVYSDSSYAGAVAANSSGTLSISNTTVDGLVRGYSATGGIGGDLYGTISITNSVNSAKVVGGYYLTGGIAGHVSGTSTIMNCVNHGDVTNVAHNDNAGLTAGILGESYGPLTFVQNYNDGTVSGPSAYEAGLISSLTGSGNVVVANNYNLGKVHSTSTKSTYVAGLINRFLYSDPAGIVANNYSIGEISRENEQYGAIDYVIAQNYDKQIVFENNFVAPTVEGLDTTSYGIILPMEQFKNGAVADSLHKYVQKDSSGAEVENGITGVVWTQGDEYPVLVTKEFFAVVLTLNGGTLENTPTTYKFGEGLVLPEPKRTGYEFKGWFATKTFQGEAVTEISKKDAGDKIFYAQWEAKEYKVTVKINNKNWGVVKGLNETGMYPYGSTVELRAVPDNGYKLSYWQDDVRLTSDQFRFTVVSDTTVTANFAAINPESSSSAESSSSTKSSSSEKSSSSSAKSSSSEGKSSSSECKGKDCKDAIPAIAVAPSFRVTAMNRELHVSGARVGAPMALLDIQGRVIYKGRVSSANFSLPVSMSGNFLVRIGHEVQRVRIR